MKSPKNIKIEFVSSDEESYHFSQENSSSPQSMKEIEENK